MRKFLTLTFNVINGLFFLGSRDLALCDVINALFHPHFSGAQKHAFMTSLMDYCFYDVINGLFFPYFSGS